MPARSGESVILGLFLVLALSVVAVFGAFAAFLPGQRGLMLELALRYVYIPVVAVTVLVGIDAWRRGRTAWWAYVLAAPLPGLNVALALLWWRRWREAPPSVGRWTM